MLKVLGDLAMQARKVGLAMSTAPAPVYNSAGHPMALAEQGLIEPRHLPDAIRGRSAAGTGRVQALHEAEYEAIRRAGWACQSNLTRMAVMLGIGRTTLWRKIKSAGIRVEDFRSSTAQPA